MLFYVLRVLRALNHFVVSSNPSEQEKIRSKTISELDYFRAGITKRAKRSMDLRTLS